MYIDSVDKIVTSYFAVLTKVPFVYKEVTYQPRPVYVSPLLLRGYTCPAGCGACCLKFSLDYLPSEPHPLEATPRVIRFDGRKVRILSDLQEDNLSGSCHNLSQEDGRCGIYPVRPFTCDFELIRTLSFEDGPNVLTQKLYGRGWNMMRIDGERGAMCEMTPHDSKTIAEVVRKLSRLQEWANHFGVDTWIAEIIQVVESRSLLKCMTPIVFGKEQEPRTLLSLL